MRLFCDGVLNLDSIMVRDASYERSWLRKWSLKKRIASPFRIREGTRDFGLVSILM